MPNKRYAYDIVKEPVGRDYERLLQCLYPHGERLILASSISAPLYEETPEIDENTLREGLLNFVDLAPHLLHAEFRKRWPGTQHGDGIGSEGGNLIYEFSCNSQTIQTILAHTTRLYESDEAMGPFLEDLSIIRPDGMELLVTITHEHASYLILRNDELKELLQQVPTLRLEKCPDDWLKDYVYWWEPFF